MYKQIFKKLDLVFIAFMTLAVFSFGCVRQSGESFTGEIVTNVVKAMNEVNTYKLDSTVTDNYTVVLTDSDLQRSGSGGINPWWTSGNDAMWFSYNISETKESIHPLSDNTTL